MRGPATRDTPAGLQFSAISVVAVAQLVESQIVILVVAGSSPVGHPKFLQSGTLAQLVELLTLNQ